MNTYLPPGPERLPLVGNLLQFRRDQLAFVTGLQRSYGRAATFYLANLPVVMFFRPEAVRAILVEQARNFTNGEFVGELKGVLGEGLLTTDGDVHRRQRRMVQPAFHKRRVEGYAEVMVAHTQQMLDAWQPGATIDLAAAMQGLTLRIVAKALFNVDLRAEQTDLGRAFTGVIENPVGHAWSLRGLPINLPITPYGKHQRALHALDQFVYTLISRRRAEGTDTGDVLSMLLAARDDETAGDSGAEDGASLSDREIRDQAMTLFAAGHETTSNALSWTFYLLARHPRERARLVAELRDVLGGRAPTVDDLARLPYLDQVVKESMRLYPPAWTQGRRAIAPFELEGYSLPAGQIVMFSQWVIHRLPDLWGDPDAFRPERFAPEAEQRIPPYAYFPFGGGPRMCIGMPFANLEARLLLATMLQRYVPNLEPGFPVVPQPRITLRLRHGLRMTLDPLERRASVGVGLAAGALRAGRD
jgi:cytochrome P450